MTRCARCHRRAAQLGTILGGLCYPCAVRMTMGQRRVALKLAEVLEREAQERWAAARLIRDKHP